MADLSISIVLYKNDVNTLKQLFASLSAISIPNKIFILDNSPSDKLKNELQSFIQTKNVQYIFTGKNLGYGAAHNIALKQVINQTKYHLVLNPDIKFNKGVIEEIYKYMEANKNVGQVIPKVLYPNGSLQYVCKLLPTPFNLFSRVLPGNLFAKLSEKFELRFSGYNKIINAPYLHGCFMFLSCRALKDIGIFDERFFMYPEDIDLTRRMHRRYKTIYYPYVSIIHEHAKSSFKNMRMFWVHATNMIKYFNKWGWLCDKERTTINKQVIYEIKNTNRII